MAKIGEGNWSSVAAHFPGRIGKQCRERWHHQLHPNINRQAWSHQEEATVVEEHRVRLLSCASSATAAACSWTGQSSSGRYSVRFVLLPAGKHSREVRRVSLLAASQHQTLAAL